MEQIFNECSLSGAHTDKYAAIMAMSHICAASAALVKFGFSRSLRTTEDFTLRELAKGYTFHAWLNDNDAPREQRTFMRSRCSQSPYVEKLCKEYGMTEYEDYIFDRAPCMGLALAHMWGIPALTLDGDTRFSASHAEIAYHALNEDCSLDEKTYSVLLVKSKNCATVHENSIRDALFPSMETGNDILNNATTALPYLEFCGSALSQLPEIDASDPYFSTILNIFRILNSAMRKVNEGARAFEPDGIHYIKCESTTTTQHPTSRAERVFMCSDGKSRLFEEHVRINIAKRIYLYSDTTQKKVYIGHVGWHLTTARH